LVASLPAGITPRAAIGDGGRSASKMEQRIIVKEPDGHWHIRTAALKTIPGKELTELEEYLSEIRLNYSKSESEIYLNGALPLPDVLERIEFFYDGFARIATR